MFAIHTRSNGDEVMVSDMNRHHLNSVIKKKLKPIIDRLKATENQGFRVLYAKQALEECAPYLMAAYMQDIGEPRHLVKQIVELTK